MTKSLAIVLLLAASANAGTVTDSSGNVYTLTTVANPEFESLLALLEKRNPQNDLLWQYTNADPNEFDWLSGQELTHLTVAIDPLDNPYILYSYFTDTRTENAYLERINRDSGSLIWRQDNNIPHNLIMQVHELVADVDSVMLDISLHGGQIGRKWARFDSLTSERTSEVRCSRSGGVLYGCEIYAPLEEIRIENSDFNGDGQYDLADLAIYEDRDYPIEFLYAGLMVSRVELGAGLGTVVPEPPSFALLAMLAIFAQGRNNRSHGLTRGTIRGSR